MYSRRQRHGYDVLVVGGGIAGLTAVWHAARHGLSAALIEGGALFGGQVGNVERLDGFPAGRETSGIALATTLLESARNEGAIVIQEHARRLTLDGNARNIHTDEQVYRAHSIVVASGCRLRFLDVTGEQNLVGHGVSQCASCDGQFFRNEDVVVVGGGDAALQEALVLASGCRTVGIVVRGHVRAKRWYVDRATSRDNVRFIWGRMVEAVLGNGTVQGVRLRDLRDGSLEEIGCSGVFPFIGGIPNAEFLPSEVNRGPSGRVITDEKYESSVPGVYAIGAIREGYSGELVAAAGEGAGVAKTIVALAEP